MHVLQLGLVFAGAAFLYVGWASWDAGYGPEVAIVRGLVGFMAVSFVGYIGELIVATASPPFAQGRAEPPGREAAPETTVAADTDAWTVTGAPEGAGEASPPALPEQERRAA